VEHRTFPFGQPQERAVGFPAREQRLDDERVEHRPAAGHLVQGPSELLKVADPLLEQVTNPCRALGQEREGIVLLDVLREHHDPHAGVLRADALGGLDALVGLGRGHPDVSQDHVREVHCHRPHQGVQVGRGVDYLDALTFRQQRGNSLPGQVVVVGEDDAKWHALDCSDQPACPGPRSPMTSSGHLSDPPVWWGKHAGAVGFGPVVVLLTPSWRSLPVRSVELEPRDMPDRACLDGQVEESDMLVHLADWCYRQRRLVVLLWIAALAAAFALASSFGGETKQDYLQPGSESQAASQILQAKFPQKAGDTVQVVLHSEDGFSSAMVRARAEGVLLDVATDPHVMGVASPFSEAGASQISQDGKTAYALVALDKTADQYTPAQAKALLEPVLTAGDDTLRVEAGGPVAALSQTAPAGGDGIGLIAAALILLLTFGSAVAMGLPLLTAVFGLGMAIALGELLRRVVDVPNWATATAAMVGIGVGIDYALLIVTRYRSGLAEGRDPRHATLTAIATAGRSVVFAGFTVVVAMLGILLVGQPALAGFAFTASLFVLVTMIASLTLLPAMLGFAGRNIERLHVPFVGKQQPAYDTTRWYRWSRFIQHRPWIAAIGALGVLLALAAPFLGIRFGLPDAQNDPESSTTHQAYDLITDGFGPGFSAPLVLTVQGASGTELRSSTNALGRQLAGVSGVALVAPAVINDAGDTAVLTVVPTTSPQDVATEDLVDTLRATAIPDATIDTGLTVSVGGTVASSLDSTRGVVDRLPLFFGGVLLVSFVLLMMVFRSVVVPLKAVIMNLLASAAAFGVLTLAANGGPLGDLVGIPDATPVPILLPIGIFAILFGLSMDYEVFLLSRIKEEYDKSGNNGLAVADGLAKSARVITAGAAVMITVFLSFVLGQVVYTKMFGIGLAAAVFIDATVVRMVLVPATMELLGDRNWWLPNWLDRLLPSIQVDGHEVTDDETASAQPVVPAASTPVVSGAPS
jgi:putative drug exporter of the RND superfamily